MSALVVIKTLVMVNLNKQCCGCIVWWWLAGGGEFLKRERDNNKQQIELQQQIE